MTNIRDFEADGDGTKENPFWQPDDSCEAMAKRRYKYCRCGLCHKVTICCMPCDDYFATFVKVENKVMLVCEACYCKAVAKVGFVKMFKKARLGQQPKN